MTPTGKQVAAFFASLDIGTTIQCVQNTALPMKVGTSGRVTKTGRTRIHISVGDERAFTLTPPSRVGDYREVTADSITYVIQTAMGESVVQWVKCGCDDPAAGQGHRLGCAVVLAGLSNIHAPATS